MIDYDHLADRLTDAGHDLGRRRAGARRARDRDAVVGLRRLGHALRDLPAARPPARRLRAPRRRRRGAPPDGLGRRPSRCTSPGTTSTTSSALRRHAEDLGLRIGATNVNLFQDPDYKLGSLTHPDAAIRRKAIDQLLECVEIATALGSTRAVAVARRRHELPRPGRPDRAAAGGCVESLREVYAALPEEQELLVEYKLFEPAFYATDLADWGSALLVCQKLGDRARVLVDLGHHAQGTNVEQIVALLAEEGRLGGFHFNNRKYADDDLIVGSVNPFELFLIFCELAAAGGPLPRLTIDQAHNVEAKVEAMVLSVVNLQEAYAKALLVDRAALAGGAGARRRARRPRGPARRLPHRRPAAVREGPRRARRGRGPGRRAPRVRVRRTGLRRARSHRRRGRGVGAMTALARMIDRAEDRWPEDPGAVPGRHARAGPARLAPARLRPRGGELRRRQHVGEGHGDRPRRPRAARHVGQGLGQRPRDDGARSTSRRCAWRRCSPLFERDEMSDEDMVAHLARCQIDPAAPRSSIETLLHAFVPADHVHHTHPDAINVLAGHARRRAPRGASASATRPRGSRTSGPGFTLAKQVGEAVRADPGLEARRARQARPRRLGRHRRGGLPAHDRGHQPRGRLRQRADDRRRRASAASRTAPPSRRTSARRCCARCCRRCAARSRASGRRCSSSTRRRACSSSSSSRDAPELTDVGAACPDHLVHTKRVPLWIPFDPSTEDAAVAGRADPRARGGVPRRLPRLRRAPRATQTTEPADPDARVVLIQHVGLVGVAPTPKNARLSRDLYHRAIEVMAGAHALGGFTSLDEGESFAVEYWPLELYKLSLAPPPGELQGTVALVTGAAGRHRPRGRRRARVGRARASWPSTSTATARPTAVADLGDAGAAVAGDVTSEDSVARRRSPPPSTPSAASTSSSRTPGVASSAAIEETTLAEWERNHAILGTGYFLVAREAFAVLRAQERGGSIVFVASKNALVGRQERRRLLVGEGGRAAPRALPGRGGRRGRDPREHGQPRRGAPGLADLGLELARGARGGVRHRPRRARGALPPAHHAAASTSSRRTSPRRCCTSPRRARSGKSTGNVLNVDGGVPAAYPR